MENQTENVSEEIQEQAPVQATETSIAETVDTQQTQETPSQSDKEYNFNQLRKSKEQLENRVGELEGHLKTMLETSPQAVPAPAPSNDFDIGDDDLAEGKHLKKMYQELRKDSAELRKQAASQQMQAQAAQLTSKFSDFNEVVTKENIEQLKQTEPELHASITGGADLYINGVAAYKALKSLGIAKDNFSSQKDQVQTNHNRPVSTQAIKGHGALSEKNIFAGGLTPELRKHLQKEMSEAKKAR